MILREKLRRSSIFNEGQQKQNWNERAESCRIEYLANRDSSHKENEISTMRPLSWVGAMMCIELKKKHLHAGLGNNTKKNQRETANKVCQSSTRNREGELHFADGAGTEILDCPPISSKEKKID